MAKFKPMLASDWKADRVKFPVVAQPKIDGVRALNQDGVFVGRSLKTFGNRYVSERYSITALAGLDGEVAAESCTHPDLCRITTSALSTHEGEPYILWWLFDYVHTDAARNLPYTERLAALQGKVEAICKCCPEIGQHLRIVPWRIIHTLEELLAYDADNLAQGYEGTIIRDPVGLHKAGRSTVKEGGLLRLKQFIDAEAVVQELEEGQHNENEAEINALGYVERSSHKENMVPNGMIGRLHCVIASTVTDPVTGSVLFRKGDPVLVGPGKLTHEERKAGWERPELVVGKLIKFQFFPRGIKDKPRFPTFQTFRDPVDWSE